MKRIVVFLCILSVALLLVSCNKPEQEDDPNANTAIVLGSVYQFNKLFTEKTKNAEQIFTSISAIQAEGKETSYTVLIRFDYAKKTFEKAEDYQARIQQFQEDVQTVGETLAMANDVQSMKFTSNELICTLSRVSGNAYKWDYDNAKYSASEFAFQAYL